jgi:hypothetical protein
MFTFPPLEIWMTLDPGLMVTGFDPQEAVPHWTVPLCPRFTRH